MNNESEEPHLTFENMTKEEMIKQMRKMEDIIIRQYIEMTSCYICKKCAICDKVAE